MLPPACALLALACDDRLPKYEVQSPVLRLISEQGFIPARGGSAFVLVELAAPDGGQAPVTLYLRAEGATGLALPGPSTCAPAIDAGTEGADAGAALTIGSAQLIIPFVALRKNPARGLSESGLVVEAGAGETDVLLLAAAYGASSAEACVVPNAPLEAFAFLRIPRRPPADAGAADAGSTIDGGLAADAGPENDAGASPDAGASADAGRDGGPPDAGSNDAGDGG